MTDQRFARSTVGTGEVVEIDQPNAADVTVVAVRVSMLPIPYVPSETSACAACGEAIWLARADATMHELIDGGAWTVCVRCAISEGLMLDFTVIRNHHARRNVQTEVERHD